MKVGIFGAIVGIVLAIAGANIVNEPVKTILLCAALCIAHIWTAEKP